MILKSVSIDFKNKLNKNQCFRKKIIGILLISNLVTENFLLLKKFIMSIKIYPYLPEVEAITNAAYVKIYPTEKWTKPTKRA